MANDKDLDPDQLKSIPHVRPEDRPDFSKPIPRKPLPKDLQTTLDDPEKFWDALYDGSAKETTDSNLRYAAYANRLRTIMLAAHRYVAYTSDIGESFRPVAHPYWVRGAYGISWAYLIGDVSHEGYKAYLRNQRVLHPEHETNGEPASLNSTPRRHDADKVGISTTLGSGVTGPSAGERKPEGRVVPIEDYRAVMVQRAVFQSIASMGLPAFTIHSIVRYSGKAFSKAKNTRIRTWGPIGLGLAAVPALPYMFDAPVEHATEWIFHKGFEFVGGPSAVGERPETGKKELRHAESVEGKVKEREL